MQTESSALKSQLAQTIDGFLRDLEQAISSASMHGVQRNGNDRLPGLQQPLSGDFEAMARRWREQKLQSLTEASALYLMEFADSLDQRMIRIVNAHANKPAASSPSVAPVVSSEPNGTKRPEAKADSNGQKNDRANPMQPLQRRSKKLHGGVDSSHPGLSPGILKHRTLVSFLESHGFERDSKQTGECVYRHDSGARLSIPPRHSNGEIAKGTACKVLRRIGEILDGDARLLGGHIVMTRISAHD